ncbi:HigA family addiction module antitoxin [uncultured Rhodospira sp.]|uniref:HigA family addiction module antitoxin n=1 Tax=uncultured Rhodospira sp. TaxID=1936189 RepID=UPI002625B666|nr:HigA family addiction module antitoxin [uncultured Rhodospira sp.]
MTSKSSITIEKIRLPAIHPGEILADELETLGVSVAAMARAIDVPQSRMADVVNGKRAVTADTALRLACYFGTSARFWLNLQTAYDLAVTEADAGDRIAAVVRPHAA